MTEDTLSFDVLLKMDVAYWSFYWPELWLKKEVLYSDAVWSCKG